MEVLEETIHKVIVFVPYTHTIELVSKHLSSQGVINEVINGAVAARERSEIINRFQTQVNPRVLVIQPQAASHGVTLTAAVGGQVINKINEDITIDGTGSSQPLGAFNTSNTALLKVVRQTANEFKARDAFQMYERHTHGPNSVWMISRRVLAQLFAMQTTNNTMVTWIPNLRDKPQMTLLGLPVIVTDLLPTLGTEGDVALVNGDFYAMGLRQALTVESSIHYKFVNDITRTALANTSKSMLMFSSWLSLS